MAWLIGLLPVDHQLLVFFFGGGGGLIKHIFKLIKLANKFIYLIENFKQLYEIINNMNTLTYIFF